MQGASPLPIALLLAAIGWLALLTPTAAAQSPTAVTTIENGDADIRLQLNNDGGFYIPGTVLSDGTENDSIPTTGAGTRLMWYPAKAAFRAGRVGRYRDGTQWDAAKTGAYSVAMGYDSQAGGVASVAIGGETTASAPASVALGDRTTASGLRSTAIGASTTASATDATATGLNTTASGDASISTGWRTTASGNAATSMGFATTASGTDATAMGNNTTAASGHSLSIGSFNSANTSADGTLFAAGNGSFGSSSDALVLDQGGNLTISGTLTESSDRRLKTSIRPLNSETLAKLSRLRPVRYEFKNQETHPSGEQIGLVAQDVRGEFPALVRGGDGDDLALSYSKFTAVLLKGLQEQQSVVDSLSNRVRNLEAQQERIDRLQARLSRVESDTNGSVIAGVTGSRGDLLIALLLGGLLGAGLLWQRRLM